MFSSLVVILAVAGSAIAQTIQTPASLVQCQPAQILFSGGSPPYIIDVIPGGQVTAPAIANLQSSITASPYTWNVNLAAGTNITLKLTDSTGAIGYSSPLVIQAGSSNACLNASASTSGIATTGAVTTTRASASGVANSTTAAAVSTSTTSLSSTSRPASSTSPASGSTTAASSSAPATSSAAAASTSSRAGAMPTALVGAGGIAAAAIGGIAMLF